MSAEVAAAVLEQPQLDHLVYGVPALEPAGEALEKQLGVRPVPGGRHEGFGTHNALLSLGPGVYLELIAPDPSQPRPDRPRPFGLDSLRSPRLVGWAVRAGELPARTRRARASGYDPGEVLRMSRTTPAGERLEWSLSYRPEPAGDGLVPFLIDWGATPHPSVSAPPGGRLVRFRAEHPEPEAIRAALDALEVELEVGPGPRPAMWALLEGPAGRSELR